MVQFSKTHLSAFVSEEGRRESLELAYITKGNYEVGLHGLHWAGQQWPSAFVLGRLRTGSCSVQKAGYILNLESLENPRELLFPSTHWKDIHWVLCCIKSQRAV